ncbi:hypothetical protein [Georgenia sp. SUBG003]|uniref:hypothetical protein n=1 Tax=Georgenia sp. SUBG003 TaxID=1497974 RepID=UPI003AB546FB
MPGQFGKDEHIAWRSVSGEDHAARLETARLQNTIAARIAAKLRSRGLTVKDYAALAGVGYDRMLKVLRGDVLMRLEDVSDAERLLGGITCEKAERPH